MVEIRRIANEESAVLQNPRAMENDYDYGIYTDFIELINGKDGLSHRVCNELGFVDDMTFTRSESAMRVSVSLTNIGFVNLVV